MRFLKIPCLIQKTLRRKAYEHISIPTFQNCDFDKKKTEQILMNLWRLHKISIKNGLILVTTK